jgi:ATP-dependent helicase/nuclease subunit B
MDALDFGVMIHAVLDLMAESGMWKCSDAGKLQAFLDDEAGKWVTARFGKRLPLPVTVALTAAGQRLASLARVQVELAGQGWDTFRAEHSYELELKGMRITGRIDRIDRHRETGAVRIIDYKTADTEQPPFKVHLRRATDDTPAYAGIDLGGKEMRWVDLQLPVYRMLAAANGVDAERVELGYFNLPKAVARTGLYLWEDFGDELQAGALTCAEAIVERIRRREFWPPSEKVDHDNFEDLFAAAPVDCVSSAGFKTTAGNGTD